MIDGYNLITVLWIFATLFVIAIAYAITKYIQHRYYNDIPGLKIVIIDHQARTVYTNLSGKRHKHLLVHELSIRQSAGLNYQWQPLTRKSNAEVPETEAFVTRTNSMYFIDIFGDIIQ